MQPVNAPLWRGAASAAALTALLLAGCAIAPPALPPAPNLPAQWSAPLPHGGEVAELAQWWAQFDDPLLLKLITATQENNGNLAQARARIAEARASARIAGAAAWPAVNASVAATRSRSESMPPTVLATGTSLALDTLWEIDLAGVTRNNVGAARARIGSAQANWHDLRVSLAAETASTYVSLRACEALVDVYTQDSASQQRTAELTQVKVSAGLESTANGALAAASAADASNRRVAQRAECDALIKALVALTAAREDELRTQLSARSAQLPQPVQFRLERVPAQWLAQRPDLAAIERDAAAAASEVGAAQADRFPRLSLTGSIAAVGSRSGGARVDVTNWSIGPALSLPLFDAGRRAAAVDAAQARYAEARARYEQRARDAVREVEEALVRLDAAQVRSADAQKAAQGFREFFEAGQARWQIGVGSLLDLEEARRNSLTAAAALVGVQRERVAAWIALYKAMGGGWSAQDTEVAYQETAYRLERR